MNKPLDRSDAVNLARNALSDEHLMGRVSREGIRTLCEAVMELDEGLTRAVQLYKDELTKQEELEARCCPEDYGVEEWICVLTRRVGERDVQIANLTAAINAMNVTRPEAVPAFEALPMAYIEHHKGGDNLVWEDPGGDKTPLYRRRPQNGESK